ncbi:MAG: hypothetical protein QM761_11605 [Pseudoxanthomonas sp.]
MPQSSRPFLRAAGLAVAIAAVLPAGAQKKPVVETQVWIDVATHDTASMPGLGAVGGFAGRLMGVGKGAQEYPQSRDIPPGTGRFLDIAMYNSLKPGVAATQQVPAGLGVGESLPLLPPPPGKPGGSSHGGKPNEQGEVDITIRQYWGCGAGVRPGQPKVLTMKAKAGNMDLSGRLAPGLFVPDRDIDAGPAYALWPNKKNTKRVSERSSLVGQHRIVGDGVPESLQFDLNQNADFMPKIALSSSGGLADSIALQWQPVERGRGYFINAMAMQDEHTFVTWSSSEVAGAGHELLDYLTGSYIDKWLAQKVLLAPATTHCAIPKGIFQPTGNSSQGGVASLSMIAYGPETNLVWPPKPADPKQPWDPEWNVRVRTKSTATAMLGVDLAGAAAQSDDDGGKQPTPPPSKGKRLLNALRPF